MLLHKKNSPDLPIIIIQFVWFVILFKREQKYNVLLLLIRLLRYNIKKAWCEHRVF